MKILLREIPHGITKRFEDALDPAFLSWGGRLDPVAISPVTVKIDVGQSDGAVFATGSVGVTVQLACVSCLEPFETRLETAELSVHIQNPSETVDLTSQIREDIFLLLPPHPRCDSDGRRKCPASFPTKPAVPLTAASEGKSAAWEALDQIKPKP